jgi:purine-binding chemotaxis protein CheW
MLLEMTGKSPGHYVVFVLDGQRYALYLSAVERIIRAVEVTPLPKAPEIVLGIINMQGRIIPVVNIRRRFRLPEREMDLSDQLIIANTTKRSVALVVDEARGIIEQAQEEVVPAEVVLPGVKYVEGVVKLEDGMILIHDLDRFLSLEEEKSLDRALKKT